MIASWGQIESYAYWGTFTVAFLAVSAWETLRPRGMLSARLSPSLPKETHKEVTFVNHRID